MPRANDSGADWEDMQCDRCRREAATVFMTEIIEGQAVNQKLCAECVVQVFPPAERTAASGWTFYSSDDDSQAEERPGRESQ